MFNFNLKFLWILLIISKVFCDYHEDNWIEPDAWGREYHSSNTNIEEKCKDVCEKCPTETPNPKKCEVIAKDDKDLTILIYKKFLAALFNKEKLNYDAVADKYSRSIEFILISEQLDIIDKYNDPRDLDGTLMAILGKSRSCEGANVNSFKLRKSTMSIAALFRDIFKDLRQLLKTSEIQFTLIALIAILLGLLIHRRYHIGVFTIVIGAALIIGYFVTYLQCNKKLEVEKMLQVLENNQASMESDGGFWIVRMLKGWFGNVQSDKEKLAEKLKKSTSIYLPYCRPDHVLMMYFNEIFLKQLELLSEQCVKTFGNLKANLGFPYNIVAGILLVFFIGYIIKLTFKYILSPKAWAALLHRPIYKPHQAQYIPKTTQENDAIMEDRLSGENLRLLLTAISSSSPSNTSSALPSSGIEVLDEGKVLSITESLPICNNQISSSSSSPDKSFEAIESREKYGDKPKCDKTISDSNAKPIET